MNVQFVDWGALLALLGLLGSVVGLAVGFLWRVIANQTRDMKERFDRQDARFDRQDERFDRQDERFEKQGQDMNERFDKQDADMAELKTDMAVVKNDLSYLKPRSEQMDGNIVRIMRDLGRLEGRQQSSSPRDKVGAGGS